MRILLPHVHLHFLDLHELELFGHLHSEELFIHLSPIDVKFILDIVQFNTVFNWLFILEEIVNDYLILIFFRLFHVFEFKHFAAQLVKKVVS